MSDGLDSIAGFWTFEVATHDGKYWSGVMVLANDGTIAGGGSGTVMQGRWRRAVDLWSGEMVVTVWQSQSNDPFPIDRHSSNLKLEGEIATAEGGVVIRLVALMTEEGGYDPTFGAVMRRVGEGGVGNG